MIEVQGRRTIHGVKGQGKARLEMRKEKSDEGGQRDKKKRGQHRSLEWEKEQDGHHTLGLSKLRKKGGGAREWMQEIDMAQREAIKWGSEWWGYNKILVVTATSLRVMRTRNGRS